MPIYPRLEGESSMAYAAFVDFCDLGTSRTILELVTLYERTPESDRPKITDYDTLFAWSELYQWEERATRYDIEEADRLEILSMDKKLELKQKRLGRINTTNDALEKIAKVALERVDDLNEIDAEKFWKLLVQTARVIPLMNMEERKETGETIEESGKVDVNVLISVLPEDLQDAFRGLLKEKLGLELSSTSALEADFKVVPDGLPVRTRD